MFKEIAPLVATTDLTISIKAAEGGKLAVIIIPKPKPGAHEALSKILSFTESPDLLDEQLPSVLRQYATERLSLEQTIAETSSYIDAAKKAVEEKAQQAVGKISQPTPVVEKREDGEETAVTEMGHAKENGPDQNAHEIPLFV